MQRHNLTGGISSHLRSLLAVLITTLVFPGQNGIACTSFAIQDGDNLICAKNYDWTIDDGFILVNKRNVAKTAFLLAPTDPPAKWVSKYGSVTFNQYGREMPNGGVNEAGLVVETLMLPNTQYPNPDDRPAVISWMQFQLDRYQTVGEVVASDEAIRIAPTMPMPVHFFVCDRTGATAVVEFVAGRLVCHAGDTMPVRAITNDRYDVSMDYLGQHAGHGGTKPIVPGRTGSLDRFVTAADRAKTYDAATSGAVIPYAFETLALAAQGHMTKWSIVYDLKNREIHYRTERRPQIKTLKMDTLDFSCQSPVRMIPINTAATGVLNGRLFDYDADLNRYLVYHAIKHTAMLRIMPDVMIEGFAAYPETTSCR